MTTSTSLSGRALAPKPPARGSFPLDHLGECSGFADAYAECLRKHQKQAGMCREEVRTYLRCRMEAGLMAREEMGRLGMGVEKDGVGGGGKSGEKVDDRSEEEGGFTSGMRLAKRKKERYGGGKEGKEEG